MYLWGSKCGHNVFTGSVSSPSLAHREPNPKEDILDQKFYVVTPPINMNYSARYQSSVVRFRVFWLLMSQLIEGRAIMCVKSCFPAFSIGKKQWEAHRMRIVRCLTIILPARWGAIMPILLFFRGKSSHFAVWFIQNDKKLTPSQALGPFVIGLHYNLAFSKIRKLSLKKVTWSMGL